MTVGLYSIKDSLVGFGYPFVQVTDPVAVRSFAAVAADERGDICKKPGDYDLYRVGAFDTDSGTVISTEPVFIARAADCVRKE